MRWVKCLLRIECIVLIVAGLSGGCVKMGPVSLQRSVLAYDETTADLEQKLLLVNIARRVHGLPVHFTVTGSIAATFDWTARAGVFSAYDFEFGEWSTGNFDLGVSGSENPTFSIFPVTGQEFAERLLTPITEEIFNSVAFQGERLDQTLRLLANGIEVQDEYGAFVRLIANDPRRPEEYEEFRRIVLHLQWLHYNRQLFVRSLVFDEILLEDYEYQPEPYQITDAIYNGLRWEQQEDGNYTLTRPSAGRLVILNYDPMTMGDYDRWVLNETIKKNPPSFIYLDIHPDEPGGDLAIQGAIKLRSIIKILDFVAAGITDYPEYHVDPDPRTGEVPINPVHALEINVSSGSPGSGVNSVAYRGEFYSVAESDWNENTFQLLTWLFQVAGGYVESPGIPITIAK